MEEHQHNLTDECLGRGINSFAIEYILDFMATWHGLTLTKDTTTILSGKYNGNPVRVTRLTCDIGDGEYFHEFEGTCEWRFKQAIDFIVEHYGWPSKADVIRDAVEEYEDQQ